jgi:hypothetical protein
MDTLTIREIIDSVNRGQIRIPAFQRGFVWEPERVAFFMDSVYKNFPFGALLFWRAKTLLKAERDLGPFKLPGLKEDFPIDYVLDGQQRVTSIYATFQTGTAVPQSEEWKDIYFDFKAPRNTQKAQFLPLLPAEVDLQQHFPLRALFDTVSYRRATSKLDDATLKIIDEVQSVFKEAKIPVQIFRTDDTGAVATIFERINRQGVRLDTLQLLSAWTWSDEFQLQKEFKALAADLADYGIKSSDSDESEDNLLLRCTSSILTSDPAPERLVTVPGKEVRDRFDEVRNGIKGAVEFLRTNCCVHSIETLPFQTILVPLAVFFAAPKGTQVMLNATQRARLIRWFWRVAYARRYSSGVLRLLAEDIEQMRLLRTGSTSRLGDFSCIVPDTFFTDKAFNIGTVNTKTFVLMLANSKPLSFVSGTPLDLAEKLQDYNKTEFHHVMPAAFLKAHSGLKFSVNCLANFAFVSRAENNHLGGVAPSAYRSKMAHNVAEVLASAFCPESLFADDYNAFVEERKQVLKQRAEALIA